MCEHLHYESVYFKELHKEQEYYIQSGGSCSVNYRGITSSHSSRENATPSSGTSPIASCKRVSPPGIFYGSADQRQRR